MPQNMAVTNHHIITHTNTDNMTHRNRFYCDSEASISKICAWNCPYMNTKSSTYVIFQNVLIMPKSPSIML